MTNDPDLNLPLSEQYRLAARAWVELDTAASLLEESKSAVLAKMMARYGDMPVSRAEMNVKASDEWREYIEDMVASRGQAALKKVEVEFIRMRFAEWNSEDANRRAEIRLTK